MKMFLDKVNYFLVDFSWIIGIISVLSLYLVYWYRRPYKFPPGPRGLPFVGYLPFLSTKIQCDVLKLREKYGPILSVRMGLKDVVFLNDCKSVRNALVKNGTFSSGRPQFPTFQLKSTKEGIAFSDYHDAWKIQRRFGLKTLKGFGVGKKGMEKLCLEELHHLNKEIQDNVGKPYDVSVILHHAVSNMICSITFGKRYDYHDKEFLKHLKGVINRFDDPLQSFTDRMITLYPALKYVPPFYFFYNKSIKEMKELFVWLEKHIEDHYKTYDENNIRDFIDAFIEESRKENDSSFTNSQLITYIHELFLAGTETTSGTLYWAILCLLHYPETQKKLRNEIKDVIGLSGTISMSKKLEMPYTSAFIHELMRFRTLGPFALPHKANSDFYLNDYFIPEGTQIMPNIWAVHNDPDLWKNPEIFHPERFLDEQGNFTRSNNMMAFSLGTRHCLGEQLAKMEVFIFLVGMVQKFEFHPDTAAGDQLPNIIKGSPGFVFNAERYKIIARKV